MNWYTIQDIETIDSPALVLYKERIRKNIDTAVKMVRDISLLRPHVKTNKISEVCRLMMSAGIYKFKCATIAEAEMLALIGAKDVLFAYQPVGPKAKRLHLLMERYPATKFSCLIDNIDAATSLSLLFKESTLNIFIDLNTGMNRSGIAVPEVRTLINGLQRLPNINIVGLHTYDGHVTDTDLSIRKERSDLAFEKVSVLAGQLEQILQKQIIVVAGGSPTFPIHATRGIECSPGTFVFWDWSYKTQLPDEPFDFAAAVITRVISIIDKTTITTDLGHKSVAAENPFPRVHFLNAPGAIQLSQSEEHLVLGVSDSATFNLGDVLYGIPYHICPTVALYDRAFVIENRKHTETWNVVARNRIINI